MDQRFRDDSPVTHPQPAAISLSWALGALASLLLALWQLPHALFANAISSGPSLALGIPAILLAQTGLCLACAPGWLQVRPRLLAVAIAGLIASHIGVASAAWPSYSTILGTLWIGPVPMLVPALIQFAAAAARGRHRA